MTTTHQPEDWEKIIEKLAMAVTHSEQGEYAKNEKFVRDTLAPFIAITTNMKIDTTQEEVEITK